MKIMGEELMASSIEPLEKRVRDRLIADLGINESEADAYVTVAYDRYYGRHFSPEYDSLIFV